MSEKFPDKNYNNSFNSRLSLFECFCFAEIKTLKSISFFLNYKE